MAVARRGLLSGVRVVVTRPRGREADLAAALRARGHDVLHVPLLAVETVGDGPIEVSGYDWVVVTSVTGARELRRRIVGRPRRVAAIGQATAAAFGEVDLVPAVSTQEGLLAELPRPAGRVLFAAAEGARSLLPETLVADVVVLYRTHELRPEAAIEGDFVVLASASAARALGRITSELPVVSIGPETSAAARAAGLEVVAEAVSHDLRGLVDAVEQAAAAAP
ncbi:MAG: uroporphyrinogen-III synthase [Gaiella sp.]